MIYPYGYLSYSVVGLIVLVLDIFAIASVLAGHSSTERKVLWTAVILILPVLGMILYYMFGRDTRDARVS